MIDLKDIVLSEWNPEENLVVDILVGAGQYWNIANGEIKRGESGPVAMNTRFGWTLCGPVENAPRSETNSVNLAATHVLRIDTETFKERVTFKNQRYEVDLPWKEAHDPLPDNRSLSQRRLQSLLKRLSLKPELLKECDRVIKEQLDKGIIERVDQSEKVQPCRQIHYLPHHCVVREGKSTTKLRIVYNASAKENGPALNDCLHTGPPLTPDILDILV
ncbi:PREDICTED: uncharacterized protein LOC107339715 [Acropora digitifera]|uniref:uncharacterized protein LOC107339715 n=1 Tax=Acropora digitifera TaxID=70779 RepID=UPI000779F71C|nr:PREDICTED: uncharacterized protein LOC107339715 [Acropora digitifera]